MDYTLTDLTRNLRRTIRRKSRVTMRDATSRAVTDKEAEEDVEAEKDIDIYEIGEYEIITTTK